MSCHWDFGYRVPWLNFQSPRQSTLLLLAQKIFDDMLLQNQFLVCCRYFVQAESGLYEAHPSWCHLFAQLSPCKSFKEYFLSFTSLIALRMFSRKTCSSISSFRLFITKSPFYSVNSSELPQLLLDLLLLLAIFCFWNYLSILRHCHQP